MIKEVLHHVVLRHGMHSAQQLELGPWEHDSASTMDVGELGCGHVQSIVVA